MAELRVNGRHNSGQLFRERDAEPAMGEGISHLQPDVAAFNDQHRAISTLEDALGVAERPNRPGQAARRPAGRRRGSGPRHTLGLHGLAVQARLNARPMAPESTLLPAGGTLKVFEVAAGRL